MTEFKQELAAAGQRVKELEEEVLNLKKELSESKDQVKKLQMEKTNCEIEAVNLKEELEKVKMERDEMAEKANAAELKLAEEDNQKENSKRDVSEADKDLVETILVRANATEMEMGKIMQLVSNAEALSPEDKKKMEDLRNKVEHLEQQLELAKENEAICEAQTKEAQDAVDRIRSKVSAADDLNKLKRSIYKEDDSDTEEEKKFERKLKIERRNSTVNNSFVNLGERINSLSKDLNLSEEKERITSLIELFKKLGKPNTTLLTPQTSKPNKVITESEKKELVPSLFGLTEDIEEVDTSKIADSVEETSKTADSDDAIFDVGLKPSSTKRVRFSQTNMDEDFKILIEENEDLYASHKTSFDDESVNAEDKDADAMFGSIEDL